MVEGGDQGQGGLPACVWKLLLKNHVNNGFGEHNDDEMKVVEIVIEVLRTMMLDLQWWNSPNEEEEKSRMDIRLNLQS